MLAAAPKPALAYDDLLDIFAECAGRYSAELEHQWLMGDPTSEQTELERAQILDVMFALMDPERDASVTLARRLEAKFAHSRLLQRAAFDPDQDSAVWAQGRSRNEIRRCASLVLAEPESVEVDADIGNLAVPTRADAVAGAESRGRIAD